MRQNYPTILQRRETPMSTENAAEKESLTGIIKPGTTLIIDFEFEDGKKTRRVVTIPERQGKK